MRKKLKFMVALAVIASMFTITAQAKDFAFKITTKSVSQKVAENQRDRTAATWLLTNSNSSSSTFVVGTHVVDFRVRDLSRNPMSEVIQVRTFITNKAYPYTTTPINNQPLLLYAQLDESSTASSVTCYGKWFT